MNFGYAFFGTHSLIFESVGGFIRHSFFKEERVWFSSQPWYTMVKSHVLFIYLFIFI